MNTTLRRLVPTGPKCQLETGHTLIPLQPHRAAPATRVRAMRKSLWSLVLIGIALPAAAWAQTGSVTGRVTDAAGTLPLVGARIQIIGTALTGQTLQDGRYTFANVPAGSYDVRVIAVGYAADKKTVWSPQAGHRRLPARQRGLHARRDRHHRHRRAAEARAGPHGHARSRPTRSLTYSPVTNMADLLQARAAGVTVLPSSGTVGTGTRIRIRGANSVSLSNEPIIVVDGANTDAAPIALSAPAARLPRGSTTSIPTRSSRSRS